MTVEQNAKMIETVNTTWNSWIDMVDPWVKMAEKVYKVNGKQKNGFKFLNFQSCAGTLKPLAAGIENLKQTMKLGDEITHASEGIFDAGLKLADCTFKTNCELWLGVVIGSTAPRSHL